MLSYVISSKNIFINLDGDSKIIRNDDKNYEKLLELIKTNAPEEEIKKLVFVENHIKEYCQKEFENSEIEIGNDTILIDGKAVYGGLCQHIKDLYERDLPLTSVVNFVRKLRKNPSYRIREQLWGFIEAAQADGGFTLDNDGNIIAYKVVSSEYKDKHSGKFDNHIGCVVEMPREDVDDNPNNTCSAGLHFCAYSYVKDFCGEFDHLMLVKVSPEDVVSIPTDYGFAKARCCKYEVIAETEKPVREPIYEEGTDEENVPDYDDNNEYYETIVTDWLDKATLKELINLYEYMMEDEAIQYDSREEYIDAILEAGGDFETINAFLEGFETSVEEENENDAIMATCKDWLDNASLGKLLAFCNEYIQDFNEDDYSERGEILAALANKYRNVHNADIDYNELIKDIADFEEMPVNEMLKWKDFDEETCYTERCVCPDCKEKAEKFCIEWLNNAPLNRLLEFGAEWVEGFDENTNYKEREDVVAAIRECYAEYIDMLDDLCDYIGKDKREVFAE